MRENGGRTECVLQGVERELSFFCPGEGGVFAREASEGSDDLGVIVDKTSIEVGETKEGLDRFHVVRSWPVSDDAGLRRVHCNTGG